MITLGVCVCVCVCVCVYEEREFGEGERFSFLFSLYLCCGHSLQSALFVGLPERRQRVADFSGRGWLLLLHLSAG